VCVESKNGLDERKGDVIMKRILCVAVLTALVGATPALLAQEAKAHVESTTKSGDTKVKTETVTGTVKAYDPGKKIKISGPNDKTYSFDLDTNARVEGTIVVGQPAKVEYSKVNGVEHVTVLSNASLSSATAVSAPKSHTESTTKSSSPAGSSKVKTETVVGTVKEFEAGKKIVVTGPKKKNYSFDLDEAASMTGSVAVGDRVKVTYRKIDGRKKVTIVSAYTGKA
jgi:hypothetical protein